MTRQEKEFLLICYYQQAFDTTVWDTKLEAAQSRGSYYNTKRYREQTSRHLGARRMLDTFVRGLYAQAERLDSLDAKDMKKAMKSLLDLGQRDALVDPENPRKTKLVLMHIRSFDIDDDEEETL